MNEPNRMDRREAIKWMLAASATISLLHASPATAAHSAAGYGTDPNLLKVYKPGDVWPLTFSRPQHELVSVLCDLVLPADEKSPSASQLKVPDFLDEWISAPYPHQRADRTEILNGLRWIDAEAKRRFGKPFVKSSESQQHQICGDICSFEKAAPSLREGAKFFAKFRDLAMGGFYSTPEGMRDIQYLGNTPLTKFDGPPPEVLAYLKLARS